MYLQYISVKYMKKYVSCLPCASVHVSIYILSNSFVSWRLGIKAQVLLHVPQLFLLTEPSLQPFYVKFYWFIFYEIAYFVIILF